MSKTSKLDKLTLGALVFLVFALYTVTVARYGQSRAEKRYEEWQVRWVNEYLDQREAEQRGMPIDPYEALLDSEAQAVAKVLYGVKDNSEEDLKTYVWCVLNRVDSADYPDTLADVIGQPQQWMRYSEDNPVLENLYQIAREQLETWHNGSRRPVSSEYIYMNWSPTKIVLRDRWEEGSWTNYWRYGK